MSYSEARKGAPFVFALGLPGDFRSHDPTVTGYGVDIMLDPAELESRIGFRPLHLQSQENLGVRLLYSPRFFHLQVNYREKSVGRRKPAGITVAYLSRIMESLGDPAILQIGTDQTVVPFTKEEMDYILPFVPRD